MNKFSSLTELADFLRSLQIELEVRTSLLKPRQEESNAKSFLSMSPSRKREYLTGRVCAVKAAQKLVPGWEGEIATNDSTGAPVWPAGIVGSISHTHGLYCAITGTESHYLSLGLDVEQFDRKISAEAFNLVANSEERKEWDIHDEERVALFSAKESVFKLLSSLTGKRFYFDAVSISRNDDYRFTAVLNKPLEKDFPAGRRLQGIFLGWDNYVVTVTYIARVNRPNGKG